MGKGAKIGIIDYGQPRSSLPEFANRIDPASQDLVGGGRYDQHFHGTWVASIAAANRNGHGIHGVAFEANLITLDVSNSECLYRDCTTVVSAMTRAVDIAVQNGARVINLSVGPGPEYRSPELRAALQRAAEAGVVLVFAAGNAGAARPQTFAAEVAEELRSYGVVVIAGSHTEARGLAEFSNRAGGYQEFVTALGVNVAVSQPDERDILVWGTSFSAPVVSGAVALLASAWPHLTGSQIVRILLNSADDMGANGFDNVWGNGILNIARAFEPQGQTTLAGSAESVSVVSNGQLSGAMGDAGSGNAAALILDGFERAYMLDIARTLARDAQEKPLHQALDGQVRTAFGGHKRTLVSITVRGDLQRDYQVSMTRTTLGFEERRKAEVLAGYAVSQLTAKTAIAFGFSESGRALQQRLAGHAQNAFLVAGDPMARSGFTTTGRHSIAARQKFGELGVTVTAEHGEAWKRAGLTGDAGYSLGMLTLDRRIGPATVSISGSRLNEEGTVLGGRFSSAFASGGSTTSFLDGSAIFNLGGNWTGYGSYRRGRTHLVGSGAMVENGRMVTDAWALDISKRNAFARGDNLAVRVVQPLRVRSGGLKLNLPVSYDYDTRRVGYNRQMFDLTPSGQEIDIEGAYGIGILSGAGRLSANAFLRHQPGHVKAREDDVGAAVRFTLGF